MSRLAAISSQLTISYEEVGQGTPLILLHAFPLSNAMWKAQMDEFSCTYRVLTPNFRGIGETSRFEEEPSIQTLAHDVALWLETLGIEEQVVLCGLSMGGYVALEFARSYPDKLRALILADTRADSETIEGKKAREEMIQFAASHDGFAVAQRMKTKLLSEATQQHKTEIVAEIEAIASQNEGANLAQLVAAMRDRRDSRAILSEITCPTLVIGGSADVVSPPDIMANIASQIPRARQVIIDEAGHLSNLENPEVFNLELNRFLEDSV